MRRMKTSKKRGPCLYSRCDGLEQHLLLSVELCGLKPAVMLRRCCVFKEDLHLHVLLLRNLFLSFRLPAPASSSVTSNIFTGHCCNDRLLQQPTQSSLVSSHGWLTVLISHSHRSWPWGRTAVVTTTSWPTLWVIIRRLPRGRAGPILHAKGLGHYLQLACIISKFQAFMINRTKLYHYNFFPYVSFFYCVCLSIKLWQAG